jgi:hypothetical protein
LRLNSIERHRASRKDAAYIIRNGRLFRAEASV